jgi:hypothetical protein
MAIPAISGDTGQYGGTGAHEECDLLFTGARVLDPETGLDGVRSVGVTAGRITSVTSEPIPARSVVDVSGHVLAPGFIDMHSHAQTVSSLRMQALDGVTTALELESGGAGLATVYRDAAAVGRPINYGYSTSWAMARMRVLDGTDPVGGFLAFTALVPGSRWYEPVDKAERDRVLAVLEQEVHEGALGIGVLVGYAPATGRREYYEVARLAARLGVPTFTHARFKSPDDPESALEGVAEVVAAACGTGAHMHLCHVNSTSLRAIDEVAEMIVGARGHGLRVTTEAYPYGAGMTMIGMPFLHPDKLPRLGIEPRNLMVVATGERVADARRLHELRQQDPGILVAIHYLDEQDVDDWDVLQRALSGLCPRTPFPTPGPPARSPASWVRSCVTGRSCRCWRRCGAARSFPRRCSRRWRRTCAARGASRWARTQTWSSSILTRSATSPRTPIRAPLRGESGICSSLGSSWSGTVRCCSMRCPAARSAEACGDGSWPGIHTAGGRDQA